MFRNYGKEVSKTNEREVQMEVQNKYKSSLLILWSHKCELSKAGTWS